MPTGKPRCPVCQGTGTVKEDAQEYEFVTRDPRTSRCMVCAGTGILNPSTKLPNGKRAFEVWRNGRPISQQRRLNVSKKAVINPDVPAEIPDIGIDRSVPKDAILPWEGKRQDDVLGIGERFEALRHEGEIRVTSKARYSQLNKVLASGKEYLIVAETEPYYMEVWMMIRAQERAQGTWSSADEERYVSALEERYKALKEVQNG